MGLTEVGISSMRSTSPSSFAATMTLRANGDAAAWRSFMIGSP